MPVDRARLGERGALACQPVDGAPGILGDRGGEIEIDLAAGLAVDRGEQLVPAQFHVVIGNVKDAAGPARAAQILVAGDLGFQNRGAQPQFGAAQGGAQSGKAAADRHQVEMQGLVHPIILAASERRA